MPQIRPRSRSPAPVRAVRSTRSRRRTRSRWRRGRVCGSAHTRSMLQLTPPRTPSRSPCLAACSESSARRTSPRPAPGPAARRRPGPTCTRYPRRRDTHCDCRHTPRREWRSCSATRSTVHATHRLYHSGRLAVTDRLAQAELAARARAPREEFSVVRQTQRVTAARRHHQRSEVGRGKEAGLGRLRDGLLLGGDGELVCVVGAPGVHGQLRMSSLQVDNRYGIVVEGVVVAVVWTNRRLSPEIRRQWMEERVVRKNIAIVIDRTAARFLASRHGLSRCTRL